MARISNTSAYPNLTTPVASDYLILTDLSDNLVTKSCTLGDVQTLFGIDTSVAKVTVSSASLLALNTTAVTLVPAPGAGKVIDIMSIDQYLDAGNTVYDFGNNLEVKIGASVFGTLSYQSANFATDLVSKIGMVITTSGASDSTTRVIDQNTAVTLETAANPTQGNGVMYFNVFYRTLTVGTSF